MYLYILQFGLLLANIWCKFPVSINILKYCFEWENKNLIIVVTSILWHFNKGLKNTRMSTEIEVRLGTSTVKAISFNSLQCKRSQSLSISWWMHTWKMSWWLLVSWRLACAWKRCLTAFLPVLSNLKYTLLLWRECFSWRNVTGKFSNVRNWI